MDLKKLTLWIACGLSSLLLAANRPLAKKGDPMAADTWRATPANFENKEVKTGVLEVLDFGAVPSDAPVAAVRIQTGTNQDENGGNIIVLMPPEKFSDFVANFSTRQLGANRGGFGSLSKAKTLTGTYVTVQSEGVLCYGLDAKTTKGLPKPSVLLQNQLTLNQAANNTRPGWKQLEFNVAQVGKTGAAETTREWDRLQTLLAQQTAKDKQPRWKAKELQDALKDGRAITVSDETAKVEWVLVWH